MKVVVDASLSLKWQLRDEAQLEQADQLLLDSVHGRAEVVAPDLWLYEVVNGIRTAVSRGRLSRAQGEAAVRDLILVGVTVVPFSPIAARAYDLACDLNLAVYDTAYIALAEQAGVDLYTADLPLYEKAKGHFAFVKWFTSYPGR